MLEILKELDSLLDGSLTTAEQIAKGRQLIEAITDNPDFPELQSQLPAITAALNDLESANRKADMCEYEAQLASRKAREAEKAYWDLVKDQTRH